MSDDSANISSEQQEKEANAESGDDRDGDQPNGQPTEADRLSQPVSMEEPPRLPFPVVGIGASAGGLEACIDFFKSMPSDAGMAFVLIQHLPPDRDSMLAEILSKHTRMSVTQIEDGMQVQTNHVYVIRPGYTPTLKDGRLHLGQPLHAPGHNHPVDDFFRSLAEEQRERAMCVVMSGMGSNGSAGALVVKAVGGIAIAQDPESAKFPSMPRHLIDSGCADFILRPGEMPDALIRFASHDYWTRRESANDLLAREQQQLSEILAILRARLRQDFSGYKKPTVLRRIQRRMGLNQANTLAEYVTILRQNASEAVALSDDLLIHVTGFFRDAEAWEVLRERVIEPLVREREPEGSIRCWVTACSSGEEAYTLAILLHEATEAAGKPLDIKVFATDTAERMLSQARNGLYPLGIESEISEDRLNRFFDKDDSYYRVKKDLRNLVVFAPQNVLQDPPFSRLDICTCRNLLIYLQPELQRRVLALLHFGLKEGGALFLGPSETIAGADDLFERVDKSSRIFKRVGPTRPGVAQFPSAVYSAIGDQERTPWRVPPKLSLAQVTTKALLDHFTPAAVTIDRQHRIVYFHGATDLFLSQPQGEPTKELLALTRQSLRGAVRAALHKAANDEVDAVSRIGFVEEGGERHRVEVAVTHLDNNLAPGHLLVSFRKLDEVAIVSEAHAPDQADDAVLLRDQLRHTQEELQGTVEELQTSNEELRAANEEVMSINEELQSSNEELETSKEELQSMNEELRTVNSQLQSKMEEQEATSNDLSSLLSSTDIAVVFLDLQLRIRRFTPATKDLFELIPSDVGRPLSVVDARERDEGLRVIERSAEAQRQLLDDLLDTSRIASGKVRLDLANTELAPLVRAVLDAIRPQADGKRVGIKAEFEEDVGPVSADASRLRQIVSNLLTNAVKFTPDGGQITVKVSADGDCAQLSVSDNGIGIEAQFLPHVFTAFSQAETSTARSYGGLGLGLAICKQLVELHGGSISASSPGRNQGATFVVRLPKATGHQPSASAANPDACQAKPEKLDGAVTRGLSILLVEDDPESRRVLSTLLSKMGAQVTQVASVAAALEAFYRSRPGIIVSDIGLPERDGYDLLQEIRSWEAETKAPPTPAIALTAFARREDRRKAREAGYQEHIAKPVDLANLVEAIEKVLK